MNRRTTMLKGFQALGISLATFIVFLACQASNSNSITDRFTVLAIDSLDFRSHYIICLESPEGVHYYLLSQKRPLTMTTDSLNEISEGDSYVFTIKPAIPPPEVDYLLSGSVPHPSVRITCDEPAELLDSAEWLLPNQDSLKLLWHDGEFMTKVYYSDDLNGLRINAHE